MSKLKLKFSVYEKRLAMQVIEQASDITGTTNKPIDFKASNGIVISSKSRPGVYPQQNEISLRGDNQTSDLDIVYGKFESTKEAIEFTKLISTAINELFKSITDKELVALTGKSGKEIKFKNCSVLFTPIQGQLVIQLLKSNFNELPSGVNSSNFNIILDDGKLKEIQLPFVSEFPSTCMINVSSLDDNQIKELLVSIFRVLSETEVSGKLQTINESEEYPDFIFESI